MTDADALAEIQRLAARGSIRYRFHALQRMDERGASRVDVRKALITATRATYQSDRDTYRVEGGRDDDGDDLTVAVALEADVVVVTIF